jgi:ribosomal-protein-alanine N-acetyltransferase
VDKNLKNALALVVGYIVLWYAGAMFNFFPFLGDSAGYTGLLLCGALAVCTCWVIDEIRKLRPENGRMTIAPMRQPEAIEIADRWKYPGEYAFYDMTADPEDYEEIVTPEKRGDRYFSVFSGNELTGFFCVEREGPDIEIGLGLRPGLTGQGRGKAFLEEILRFVRENYSFEKIKLDVVSFNQRAIKVYERAGFLKTGTAKVSTNGGVYDFVLMELER